MESSMTSHACVQAAFREGFSPVAILLKLEAVVVAGAALAAYYYLGFSWWIFAALILAPDLSAVGYIGGARLGAWTYNLTHTYVAPFILGVIGYMAHQPLLLAYAAIWFTHIGGDRLLGYGLKFPGDPKDNHLTRLSSRPT
jgi:hypothetical protein